MASTSSLNNNCDQAIDLTLNHSQRSVIHKTSARIESNIVASTSQSSNSNERKHKRHRKKHVNIFKKHKLKYRYLLNRHKHASDSGNFGSSSMMGSSSTGSNEKRSNGDTTSSMCTSSSPSSGASDSPVTIPNLGGNMQNEDDQPMCMMLRHAVPLIVMMQGQLQSTAPSNTSGAYTTTTLFKCNMCSMFSNNLNDVLNHVNSNHANVHYCFVCNQFHSNKSEYDRHKDVCATAHQAFKQIIGGHHYQGNNQSNATTSGETQDHPMNLSVAENVAIRAAQIVHNRKGSQKKIKKLQKCHYCKKAFFGRFYLQRHLRSHTGEKLCHCSICGKGFAEWRNLRNHMSRFHNSSESASSTGQSKSVSPNITSDSDQVSTRDQTGFRRSMSTTSHKQSNTQSMRNNSPEDSSSLQMSTLNAPSYETVKRQVDSSHPSVDVAAWNTSTTQFKLEKDARNARVSSASDGATGGGNFNQASERRMSHSSEMQMPDANDEPSYTDLQPVHLGSTSSRLELSTSQEHGESLNPVCDENGEKSYQCNMCNKVFRTKFAMQRHLDFHADKRPFQCDQCNYKAKTKPQLKVHVMRHTGEKGFNCSICNYSCVTHSDLNRHCKSRSHLFRASLVDKNGSGPHLSSPSTSQAPDAHTGNSNDKS